MKKTTINNKIYQVCDDEFKILNKINNYNGSTVLEIPENYFLYDRMISLIKEFSSIIKHCVFEGTTHGGYIPIECASVFEKTTILNVKNLHKINTYFNIENLKITNMQIIENKIKLKELFGVKESFIYVLDNITTNSRTLYNDEIINNYNPIIICNISTKIDKEKYTTFLLENTFINIHVPMCFLYKFNELFFYYIKGKILKYDNLLNLCVLVKNGGILFETMLKENMEFVDEWTILDTGSTDNTICAIKEILRNKKVKLCQEEFINFRESRNRCLELAGTSCVFNIMLDDSYIIKGNIREFLTEIRGDQKADSYSLYIQSDDIEYTTNRVIKSNRNLKYIHTMHEVIQDYDNLNICIPKNISYILDIQNDESKKRTLDRKNYDVKCLLEMIEKNPDEPRHYYYVAQTYNVLNNHEKAIEFFNKRIYNCGVGFIEEKYDAVLELARLYQLIGKPWDECMVLYNLYIENQPERPDAHYFVGFYYYEKNDLNSAYFHLKKAFCIGYPLTKTYTLKPTISYYFVPFYLAKLCYIFEDYTLGYQCTSLFVEKNTTHSVIHDWFKIFYFLHQLPRKLSSPINEKDTEEILCIVADGGFATWNGNNIETTGVGGSETWVIETARWIAKLSKYKVYVFCNCDKAKIYQNVHYFPLSDYVFYILNYKMKHCIISRFSEYVPVSIKANIENIHLILHDIKPSGSVIPIDSKLKNIFCLTEWHKSIFVKEYPALSGITKSFHYGIDFDIFLLREKMQKKPFSFIYSSFANRGLSILLEMWPKIQTRYPTACLNIFTDLENEWANTHHSDELNKIKKLLIEYKIKYPLVINHGWVSKKILASFWHTSHIWFYPCIFMETFCLTALEAAVTKTFIITNDLAALQNTVSDRGVIVPGNANTNEWKTMAFDCICEFFDKISYEKHNELIQRNYDWALLHSWELRVTEFLYILDNEETNVRPVVLTENLNYLEMYNWTNNIPIDTLSIFIKILSEFTNYEVCSILEIGVYVGTSIITMLKHLPQATAVTIDSWKNYEEMQNGVPISYLKNIENDAENVFYENIKKANVEKRILPLKGESTKLLFELVASAKKFDFIYIDASHQCLDVYSDCLIAWVLLNQNGIMGMDDYLYKCSENVLDNPKEGIDHFLLKIKNEYEVLHIGYRIFIKKI